MNSSKHINPEVCISCGKCCKSFSIVYLKDLEKEDSSTFSEVQRFKDLLNNRIVVSEESDRFLVTFDFPQEMQTSGLMCLDEFIPSPQKL